MTEVIKKKTFAEKYPNHQMQTRGEKITNMTPAQGWWKIEVLQIHFADDREKVEFGYEVLPVAFFAQVEYEERTVWDGNDRNPWEKEVVTIAHTAIDEEWFMQVSYAPSSGSYNEKLFYDPDYRSGCKLTDILQEWADETVEYKTEQEIGRLKRAKEKVA